MQLADINLVCPAPDRLPAIIRLLIDARIGAEEDWSADVTVEATVGTDLVGCCATDFVGNVAILHSLAVEKHMRRRGIGKALVEYSVEIAGERHAEWIVTFTMFWNINFFRKCGFVTTSRKLLPECFAGHPWIFDPLFRRATPMVRQIDHDGRG